MKMTVKLFRRGSARCIGLLSAFITILLCLYYISLGQPAIPPKVARMMRQNSDFKNAANNDAGRSPHESSSSSFQDAESMALRVGAAGSGSAGSASATSWETCNTLSVRNTNITTLDEYANFDFQPEWMRTKEYWDKLFETRYEQQKQNSKRPPLKVIIVPHSHNDPGWLKTFMSYFQSDSRQIINLIVTKLQEFKDMTFIWSEISFLQLWWDQAHPTKQRALKHLIQSGRIEITTGGWVMTDEANVHVYAMLDQLIEGHQWVKTNLNITPQVGWSIDPFGHGSTVPYLLSGSDFEGAIIQRIHYAWKQWFARQQSSDFIWSPFWQTAASNANVDTHAHSLLTHNMPFDIYSIKHSCGPHPVICLNFDFRKIPGEYTEYSIKAQFITDENVAEKAKLLLEQYARTASLFPHNVALIPIGDDFRYNREKEVDQQYLNYKKLIDHINANRDTYKTEISFGTPKDYFREIKKRSSQFPTLKGDFFVYSDIFSEGRPAYWSGYFTTRPFFKILSTQLEHNLRAAEILFTIAFNFARQSKNHNSLRVFEKNYEKMILARRNLGLFQHHDAITGTSKAAVMRDYGIRLFESIQDVVKMQESTIELLIQNESERRYKHGFVLSELERDNYSKLPRKTTITFEDKKESSFVIFNSLAQEIVEVITINSPVAGVKVFDDKGVEVPIQISPIWNISDSYENQQVLFNERISVSPRQFEILFVYKLAPLSLVVFKAQQTDNFKDKLSTIYCNECNGKNPSVFEIKGKQPGDIQLENSKMRLLFDEKSGFLKTITKKNVGRAIQCAIKFAAYKSAQFHSGAYLFKTDPEQHDAEKDVLEQYEDIRILIASGPIASEVTVLYNPFLAHTIRIFNTHTYLDDAIYIENDIDFEPPPKNRETEMFMRFVTEIENGETPEFYSDQNGFQYHKRVKVPTIGVEGNYFPITQAAFIQDTKLRLTLLTMHAQGAASLEPGQLEVMLDRRTLYDDYRGMGEGVVDSHLTRHQFWVTLESIESQPAKNKYEVPSFLANRLATTLRYPANIYFIENSEDTPPANLNPTVRLLKHAFPCDAHLMNFRTLTEEQLPLFPSRAALLIVHRQAFDCGVGLGSTMCDPSKPLSDTIFKKLSIERITETTLTGLKTKKTVHNLAKISLEPMEIKTFNITLRF